MINLSMVLSQLFQKLRKDTDSLIGVEAMSLSIGQILGPMSYKNSHEEGHYLLSSRRWFCHVLPRVIRRGARRPFFPILLLCEYKSHIVVNER